MRIKLEIELIYDEKVMHGDDEESKRWFYDHILGFDELTLFSKEIGDEIGYVIVLNPPIFTGQRGE